MFGSYKVSKALEITGSIQNLFDRISPFDPQASYGATKYNPSYTLQGAVGRYFKVGAKYVFN